MQVLSSVLSKKYSRVIIFLAAVLLSMGGVVHAANTPNLTQQISAGTLTADVKDENGVTVGAPAAAFAAQNFAFTCLTGLTASTATLGTNTQRVYVSNPDAADSGWTLTIAATGGATTRWSNAGASQFYDFNDPGGSGCTDGGDADASAGQLSIDPSVGAITTDCASCNTTGVTRGASASFNQGSVDSITLINAAAGSDDVWQGYLTGVALSQTIPASQAVEDYSINMTLTATSL